MNTPDQIAKTLHDLLFKQQIPNSFYEGEVLKETQTPDYDQVFDAVQTGIQKKENLAGEYAGWKTSTLVKLAIQGGFHQTLQNPGSSPKNYRMIQHLWEKTKEDKAFWESPESVSPEATPEKIYLLNTTAKPAAALVACRMELETFSMAIRGNETEALREAVQTATLLKDSPAFRTELAALRKFCRLEEIIQESLPQQAEIKALLQKTAQSLVRKDYQSLCSWKGGNLGLELDSAIKLHLFTGESGSPSLNREIQRMKPSLKKIREIEEIGV